MSGKEISELIKLVWAILKAPYGGKDFSEFLDTLDVTKMPLMTITTVCRSSYIDRKKIPNYDSFIKKCYDHISGIESSAKAEQIFIGLLNIK